MGEREGIPTVVIFSQSGSEFMHRAKKKKPRYMYRGRRRGGGRARVWLLLYLVTSLRRRYAMEQLEYNCMPANSELSRTVDHFTPKSGNYTYTALIRVIIVLSGL